MSTAATTHSEKTNDLSRWVTPALVFGAAVLLGHAPLAVLHLRSLWAQEQYQYFPFVIGAIVYLLWSRWQQTPDRPEAARRWASLPLWITAAALVLLVGAIVAVSPWLAFVSLNIGLAALFMLLGRQRAIPYLWGIWLLLWLLVPLPLGVDNRLVQWLQQLSSQLSSTILDLLGILHLMAGNVLQLPSKEFFVDEACSGIISVMSMIACAAIYAVWNKRSVTHLVALILSGVAWALVLNVLRISLIAAAYHFFDFDLSTGAIHDGLGLALFLLMFLALVSTDCLLELMLAPIDTTKLGEAGQNNKLVRLWNRTGKTQSKASAEQFENRAEDTDGEAELQVNGRGIASLRLSTALTWSLPFLLLGIVQLGWLPSSKTAEAAQALEQALALDDTSLPKKIGPWILESFESVEREAYSNFGRYSQSFRYRHEHRDGVSASVSLDFPYIGGWHDLCVCYTVSGWSVRDRAIDTSTDSQTPGPWPYVVGELEKPSLEKAYVTFAGFDATGETAEPPSDAILFRPWNRLRRRLLLNVAPQLYQVQVFASGNASEDLELRQQLQELLFAARQTFRDQVAVTTAE